MFTILNLCAPLCLVDRFPGSGKHATEHQRTISEEFTGKLYPNPDKIMPATEPHAAARRSELIGLRGEDGDFGEQMPRLYTKKQEWFS